MPSPWLWNFNLREGLFPALTKWLWRQQQQLHLPWQVSAALRGLPALACLVIPAESLDTNQYSYLLCADSNTFRSREEVVWVARAASVLEPAHEMGYRRNIFGRYLCECVIEPNAKCMPEKKAKGNNFVPCLIYIRDMLIWQIDEFLYPTSILSMIYHIRADTFRIFGLWRSHMRAIQHVFGVKWNNSLHRDCITFRLHKFSSFTILHRMTFTFRSIPLWKVVYWNPIVG